MRTNPMPLRAAAASARLHAVPSAVSPPAPPPAPAVMRVPPERAEAQALIARLRDHLARTTRDHETRVSAHRSRRRTEAQAWTIGLAEVDRFLPADGLAVAGLHDVAPEAYGDFPSACGFALALAVRRLADMEERRPVLWCRLETEQREYGACFGHGIAGFGLPRARFLTLSLKQPIALLWTFEEALKSGCLSVVLGDVAVQQADLTATRRLALAGQAGRTSGIALFTRHHPGSTASVSRWSVAAARSAPASPDMRAPGPPAWAVSLTRSRGGRPGSWLLNWQKDHASSRFTLVPGFSGGALHPGAAEEAGARAATQSALRAG